MEMMKLDPEGQSKDIINMNLEYIKAIIPEIFSEGKIDIDKFRQLLGEELLEGEEKFGLFWHGKKEARKIALTPSQATLIPIKNDSRSWDSTKNIFVEGDNLEVLKLLQKSYANRIKMIYFI